MAWIGYKGLKLSKGISSIIFFIENTGDSGYLCIGFERQTTIRPMNSAPILTENMPSMYEHGVNPENSMRKARVLATLLIKKAILWPL